MIRRSPLALALLLPVAAFAQTPPPARPAAPPRPIAGVSAEGMVIVEKMRGPNDPQLLPLVRAQRQAQQALVAATLASTIDPERVASLLKADETARAAVRTHQNDQMIAVLRQLPAEDRAPFLRSLIKPAATTSTPAAAR